MRSTNLMAKFLLELAALASLAYWGTQVGTGATSIVLAVFAPLMAAAVWGRYAAPQAKKRLPVRSRVPVELVVFALAVAALAAAGRVLLAVVLAIVMAVNAALLTWFRQWES